MRIALALLSLTTCFCLAPFLSAQDAVKVDPKHYSVMSENNEVRILKAHYGPHEKSVMHSHPDAVAVYLTDGKIVFHLPDGKALEASGKAGEAMFTPAGVHLPENVGDAPMDVIVIELKGKHAATKPATTKPATTKPTAKPAKAAATTK
jgi:oxalate decarboxylase/phosphoglucose isomerase-like protein (cupin superfamily)